MYIFKLITELKWPSVKRTPCLSDHVLDIPNFLIDEVSTKYSRHLIISSTRASHFRLGLLSSGLLTDIPCPAKRWPFTRGALIVISRFVTSRFHCNQVAERRTIEDSLVMLGSVMAFLNGIRCMLNVNLNISILIIRTSTGYCIKRVLYMYSIHR